MIPLCVPNMTGREQVYAAEAISSGWVNEGPFVEKFEALIAEETKRKWCIATITGTAALHLALCLYHEKNIAMPSFTFIAGANAIRYRGSEPVFRDIDSDWSPDYSIVGNVCDAAPAITKVKFFPHGKLAILSFNANKIITTGQGGAIVGDDPAVEAELRHLASTAKVGPYIHDRVGLNYRMSNINAAVGCAQMERLIEFQFIKDGIMRRYRDAGLKMIDSCWMALWNTNREGKILKLVEKGIGAKAWWMPIHLQEPYRNGNHIPMPRTEELWKRIVSLPCSTNLTEQDQNYVIEECLSLPAEEQMQAL